jgi:hypothetical protein
LEVAIPGDKAEPFGTAAQRGELRLPTQGYGFRRLLKEPISDEGSTTPIASLSSKNTAA